MSHVRRPTPAKRLFASLSEPHYPVRESDGVPYVGTMLDMCEVRIQAARDTARRLIRTASESRRDGEKWARCMNRAAESRALFAGLLRSGGRVDWRGQPVQENV